MKLSPGDIVEIATPDGLVYVQVTHDHVSYPQVVRVLPGRHACRPEDLDAVAAAETVFVAMVPLGEAITAGRIAGERVGSAAIPERDRAFPVFAMPVRGRDGAVAYWWYWDGEGLSYAAEPGAGAEGLPLREVINPERFAAKLAGRG